jgi:ATP-binding cassette subfamily B protein
VPQPLPPPTAVHAYVWHVVRGRYAARIAGLALLWVGIQLCETAAPVLLGQLVNRLASGTGVPDAALLDALYPLIAVWIVSFVLIRAVTVLDIYSMPLVRAASQHILLEHMFGHAPRFFQENFAGALGQKVKQASESVMHLVYLFSGDVPRILVAFLASGIMLWRLHESYATFLLAWMLAYLLVSAALARRCTRYSADFQKSASSLSGSMIDTIANFDVVRSFAKGRFELARLGEAIDFEASRSQRLRWFLSIINGFQAGAMLMLLAVFVWMGARDAAAGRITVGDFTMVFGLGTMIVLQVQNLSFRMLDFFQHVGTLQEAMAKVAQPHEIMDAPGAPALQVTRGAIRIRDVRFAHPDGTTVFDGLDLEIAPGEKVGLVGPSGAGKSTLVKLIRRHYEPQRGTIEIDGQDIAAVTWDSLNEAIAEVPQSPGIFHRSILDNIGYADADTSEEIIRECAATAHAHDFIERRPEGYQVIVGEQGVKLSGGERQRVAIARALVKNAKILVLDEATSALDSESEHLIQQALWDLFRGRTVVAIAHRLSTVTGMDRILYVDHGRIVEQGSHAELLARGGAYARLWHRQMQGFVG